MLTRDGTAERAATGAKPTAGAPEAASERLLSGEVPVSPAQPDEPGRSLAGLDLTRHRPDRAGSLWVVVNKAHPLSPLRHAPKTVEVDGSPVDVRAAQDLRQMLAAARRADSSIRVISAFRSYAYQADLHERQIVKYGSREEADRWSARPGFSEHQTGLAVDVADADAGPGCQLGACFDATPAGRWVARHAHEYGWIVRYTRANRQVTGYNGEPWHLRYVGRELASVMRSSGAGSLEEVFGVDGGSAYPSQNDPGDTTRD